ncbi:MAG: hypothetical protein KC474_08415 [Cyanobacteria bacterium HKST-UBA04]|nr:hypothetical protein [Cyanobacteria bacterium HKST-UBA04]MCA9842283.1 hypothetical protein [Cyanobacteria bacterium HKST-UBA03]
MYVHALGNYSNAYSNYVGNSDRLASTMLGMYNQAGTAHQVPFGMTRQQHLRTLAQNDLDSFRNTTLANVGMKLNEMQMDFWLAQMDKAHKFMRRQLGLNN